MPEISPVPRIASRTSLRERVVDVFYVTDLLGEKIGSPTRQAAIKRPLLGLFASPAAEGKPAREAAG